MYIITIMFLVAWRALTLVSGRRALRRMAQLEEEEQEAEAGQH